MEFHTFTRELQGWFLDSVICFSFLGQVYLDMAVLVEAQSEILDNIENQVGPTSWYAYLVFVVRSRSRMISLQNAKNPLEKGSALPLLFFCL